MSDPQPTELLALLGRRVRFRFGLTIEAFADQVHAIVTSEGSAGSHVETAAALSLEDLYLAASCASGDERAWTEWVGAYRPFMIRFAARIVSGTQAHDLVDAVIAHLWERRKLARYQGRSSLRTWLGSVVAHAAISARRAVGERPREAKPEPRPSSSAGVPDPAVISDSSRILSIVLAAAIAALPVHDRILLLMYYEQGLTLDEAARVLGGSKSTLSRRLAHAREAVRAAAADLARSQYAEDLEELRRSAGSGEFEFDLRRACALPQRDTVPPDASKEVGELPPR